MIDKNDGFEKKKREWKIERRFVNDIISVINKIFFN